MRVIVRPGVFETNSSMTHTLIIASKEDAKKWENGEMLWCNGWKSEKRLVTLEEKEKMVNDPVSYWDDEDFYTYEDFMSDRGYYQYEHDEGEFTSPSGDDMVWFSAIGHD